MAMTYKTPGVYVEEISTLPPPAAEAATAAPAFLGCTERGPAIARVDTMLEFEELFGGAPADTFAVTTATDAGGLRSIVSIERTTAGFDYLLYHAIDHYFKNGGGSCYVVSVGDYSAAPDGQAFDDGLALLEREDEPTLILLTDAVNLAPAD